MSNVKQRLEHNKSIVDSFLAEKKYTFGDMVGMDGGLEFLEYLAGEGIADSFATAKYVKQRGFISNYEVFPMIYMMNILSGDWSVRQTRKILSDGALLRIMGFTSEQTRDGLTKRGAKNQYGEGFKRQSGIMASTTVIDNLACFDYQGLEDCFNSYIRRVSKTKKVDFGDIYILDSTIVETSPEYPGAGMYTRGNDDDERGGESIWGFKVFLLSSAKTMTPVAVFITTANEADAPVFTEMINRGIANLGKGKIKIVLADRGFIDGQQLYQLKYKMGIDFVIPARKNMDIWKCVTGLRNDRENNIEEWNYGKSLYGGYLSKGTKSYSQYAEKPEGYKKDAVGAPLNAVVVTRWDGKEIASGREKVILTSLETDSAIKVIKLYGQRSLIENRNFRELKQAAALSSLPQYKNKDAAKTAKIHMLLCVFTLAVFNVLTERVFVSSDEASKDIPRNIREFRFIKGCEKPKVFILVQHYYHIYDFDEFMKLAGFAMVAFR